MAVFLNPLLLLRAPYPKDTLLFPLLPVEPAISELFTLKTRGVLPVVAKELDVPPM